MALHQAVLANHEKVLDVFVNHFPGAYEVSRVHKYM